MIHVRRFVIVVAIAAAGAFMLGGPAAAPTLEYPTTFTKFKVVAGTGGGKVTGKVGSSEGACVPDRKVKAYRKRNGKKKTIGSDKTNSDGKWKIKLSSVKNGKYYGEVKEKDLSPTDTGQAQLCLGVKSGKITIS